MLSYNPRYDQGSLYLFDESARAAARADLPEDIQRLVSESGDAMRVSEFRSAIYNHTPAHSDDIDQAIIDSPELDVVTLTGGERRKSHTIRPSDVIKKNKQIGFVF
ncbi:MAG: hypothetical protein Kilf2KO_31060 [Rhodospirillales bacterium]